MSLMYKEEEIPYTLSALNNLITRFEGMVDIPTNPNERLEVRLTYCMGRVSEAKSLIKQAHNVLGK
jgi:hypothetical protein